MRGIREEQSRSFFGFQEFGHNLGHGLQTHRWRAHIRFKLRTKKGAHNKGKGYTGYLLILQLLHSYPTFSEKVVLPTSTEKASYRTSHASTTSNLSSTTGWLQSNTSADTAHAEGGEERLLPGSSYTEPLSLLDGRCCCFRGRDCRMEGSMAGQVVLEWGVKPLRAAFKRAHWRDNGSLSRKTTSAAPVALCIQGK